MAKSSIFKLAAQIAAGMGSNSHYGGGLSSIGENIVYRQESGSVGGDSYNVSDALSGLGEDADINDMLEAIGIDMSQEGTGEWGDVGAAGDVGGINEPVSQQEAVLYSPSMQRLPDEATRGISPDAIARLGEELDVPPNYDVIFNSAAGRMALNSWGQEKLDRGENQQYFDLVQAAVDNGDLQGIGIDFANAMEYEGLRTFGKNMRSSLEAWTPGDGLDRDKYDPGILIGLGHLTEDYWARRKGLAAEKFVQMLGSAKPGATVADVSEEYKARHGEYPPAGSFGYSINSNAPANYVAGSLGQARTHGGFKGIAMIATGGLLTGAKITTQGYRLKNGQTIEDDAIGRLKETVLEEVSSWLPDFLTKTPEAVRDEAFFQGMYTPGGKVPEQSSLLQNVGEAFGKVASAAEWVTSPVQKAISAVFNMSAGDPFSHTTVSPREAGEEVLEGDPFHNMWTGAPIPIENTVNPIYYGPNIAEEAQPFSQQQVASLPIVPEEDTANIYGGAMATHFDKFQSQEDPQNPFTEKLLQQIYQT